MPIYEYECEKCGNVKEVLQNFSDKPLTKCPHCSGKMHKLISQSSFHLKGSGWYVTDYAKKSSAAPSTSKTASKTSNANDGTSSKSSDSSGGSGSASD
ncbi:MAG: FmdB family zinc ribbon protein [Desulfobacterales bacterium]